MKKKVYFVRHGQTDHNREEIYQFPETPLSAHGLEQAAIVAERFKRIPVEIMITSTMERAEQTARIIRDTIGVPMVSSDLFIEILRPSVVRGKPINAPEVTAIMNTVHQNFDDLSFRYSDEENFLLLKKRAEKALDFIIARPEKKILVVTHGFFSRIVLALMMFGTSVTPPEFRKVARFFITENTSLSLAEYDSNGKDSWDGSPRPWRLHIWNDHAHLG